MRHARPSRYAALLTREEAQRKHLIFFSGRILDTTGSFREVFLLLLAGVSLLTTALAFALPETGKKQRDKRTLRT